MSKVKIEGNASGTGTLTISAPNTNTDRSLTLPDGAGEILTDASTLSSSNLSGALPAIDGSALTGISSDYVKLGSGTASSVSSLSIDGYYTSDYDKYEIHLNNFYCSTTAIFYWRSNVSGSPLTSSIYRYCEHGTYAQSGTGNVSGQYSDGKWNNPYFQLYFEPGTANTEGHDIVITVYDPLGTTRNKTFQYQAINWKGDYINAFQGVALAVSTAAHSGINIFPSTGNISNADWAIYGIK